jgi:hypothetical protein
MRGSEQNPTARFPLGVEVIHRLRRSPHHSHSRTPVRLRVLLGLLALAMLAALSSGPAAAAAAEPVIDTTTVAPEQVNPGEWLAMYIVVNNDGDAPMSGDLTVRYVLDNGLSINPGFLMPDESPPVTCTPSGQEVECTIEASGNPPGHLMRYKLWSLVEAGATGTLDGDFEVSGAGAANTDTVSFSIDTGPTGPFQFTNLDVGIADNPTLPPAQAGSHPFEVTTKANFYTTAATPLGFGPYLTIVSTPESFRNLLTKLPAGFIGNPTATPSRCTSAQLSTLDVGGSANPQVPICPEDSQVGTALINGKDFAPIFNLVPPSGVPAAFGIYYQGVTVRILAKLRPSDNGVDLYSVEAPTADRLQSFKLSFWGTPGESAHDNVRAQCTYNLLGATGALCPVAAASVRPFVRLPTSCSGPLPWEMEMDTYEHPGIFHRRSTTTPAPTGCDAVPFDPQFTLGSTQPLAHTPSGFDVELNIPQGSQPDEIAQADLKRASVTFPEGVSLNPAAAEGLSACSDTELRLGLEGPTQCPEGSRIGQIELHTPLLDHPLSGSLFLRSQASHDPSSGELYRVAIEIRSDADGVDLKLPGSLRANPQTGQLTTTFDQLPQLPFDSLQLHLKNGPRAPLTTPSSCGTHSATVELEGWNGAVRTATPSFTISQDCTAAPFAPGFHAGVSDSRAGSYSPFLLRVNRDPGEPNLGGLDATFPEGELAKLAGVPYCPEADATTGNCPAQSQVGHILAGLGEGPNPLFLPQPGKSPTALYLAGPYRGAPYSIIASVPAQAGPFDLGTVVVRSAVRLDPVSTRVSVQSDPLPQIYAGIPVSYRDLRIAVDRPGFTLNPTDCDPKAVDGELTSATGQSLPVSDHFQVSDCGLLPFKPKFSLALSGKTHRRAHPSLIATLKGRPGDANIAAAQVKLPAAAFLDNAHIGEICTRVQFAAQACPAGSIYGKATATTPLLNYPLAGPVYLRSSSHQLPDLVVALRGTYGEQINVELAGKTDSVNGALRNTFETVPDAPVTNFRLELFGGKRGLIEMSSGFCANPRATIKLNAQNGKESDTEPVVKGSCAKPGKRRHRAKR